MDYEIDYNLTCPHCGSNIHWRRCSNVFCEEGKLDLDADPLWPEEEVCEECKGIGIERWCPGCGKDLSGYKFPEFEQELDY
jgi:rRNA maturation protein Nop10